MKNKDKIDGYNERHLAQLIRRRMMAKIKPNGKNYSRNKMKKGSNESFSIYNLAN